MVSVIKVRLCYKRTHAHLFTRKVINGTTNIVKRFIMQYGFNSLGGVYPTIIYVTSEGFNLLMS